MTPLQRTLATGNLLALFDELYGELHGAEDGTNTGKGVDAWKELNLFALFAKAVFCTGLASNCIRALQSLHY